MLEGVGPVHVQLGSLEAGQGFKPVGRKNASETPFGPTPETKRRSGGLLRRIGTYAIMAAILGAAGGCATMPRAEAQGITTTPSVQAAQLGTQSFAVGSPLAPISAKQIEIRAPSAKDLASSISGYKSTVTGGHTPYMSLYFEPGVEASVTRHSNAWNGPSPHNIQYTIKKLPKDGMIHVSMPVWVSGHCPDQYDPALYLKFTGKPQPTDLVELKMANAKLYVTPGTPMYNVHKIWLHREGQTGDDQLLVPGLGANNEYVHLVQFAIAAKPGDVLTLRWSPFHPVVAPEDFIGGRTATFIVPKDVEIER